MYELKLPLNTLVVAGRQRTGKSTATDSLIKNLLEDGESGILVICDNPFVHSNNRLIKYINLESTAWEKNGVQIHHYDTVIFDINCTYKKIEDNKMLFDSYYNPCEKAQEFINALNEYPYPPHLVITSYLDSSQVDYVIKTHNI